MIRFALASVVWVAAALPLWADIAITEVKITDLVLG